LLVQAEVAVLKEHIGKKRVLLTDNQRRRLAIKGKILGRKALNDSGTLLNPGTIPRWH
jgi:putative transposase